MNCFERVDVKDLQAQELIVGGEIADTPYGEQLKGLKVKVCREIKEAISGAKKILSLEKQKV